MTDLEMLKLAAKAGGLDYLDWNYPDAPGMAMVPPGYRVGGLQCWNSLANQGDGLRLLAAMRGTLRIDNGCAMAEIRGRAIVEYDTDASQNACRAITRAAALVGERMP